MSSILIDSYEYLFVLLYLAVFCKARFNNEDGKALSVACLIAMAFHTILAFNVTMFEGAYEYTYHLAAALVNSSLFTIIYAILKHTRFKHRSTNILIPLAFISLFPTLKCVEIFVYPYEYSMSHMVDNLYMLAILCCHGWLIYELTITNGDKGSGQHSTDELKRGLPTFHNSCAVYDDSRSPLMRHVANTLANQNSVYHYKEYLQNSAVQPKEKEGVKI